MKRIAFCLALWLECGVYTYQVFRWDARHLDPSHTWTLGDRAGGLVVSSLGPVGAMAATIILITRWQGWRNPASW